MNIKAVIKRADEYLANMEIVIEYLRREEQFDIGRAAVKKQDARARVNQLKMAFGVAVDSQLRTD